MGVSIQLLSSPLKLLNSILFLMIENFPSFSKIIGTDLNTWTLAFRIHFTKRLFERSISEQELYQSLRTGIIIEEYLNDFPFPSYLVNGFTKNLRPIHIVIGVDKSNLRLYFITIYEPDHSKWSDNYCRRIKL